MPNASSESNIYDDMFYRMHKVLHNTKYFHNVICIVFCRSKIEKLEIKVQIEYDLYTEFVVLLIHLLRH